MPKRVLAPKNRIVKTEEEKWTEKKLLNTIRAVALECKWMVYHTQVSLYSARGFPDLCMVKDGKLLLWELKGPKGKVSKAQDEWIDVLREVPGVDARVVYPDDLEAAYKTLMTGEWPA